MNLNRRTMAAIAAAGTIAMTLTACGGSGDGAKSAPDSKGNKAATLMLNWYPYGEHAPFYYGVQKGIFAKHGIDLTIDAGQGSTKTAQAVGAKQAEFGWADTPAVLSNIDKGVKIKSVSVFLQTTPSAVQVFADSGINTPKDLIGKTIAVSAGDAPTTTFPIYLDKVGIAKDQVTQQSLDAAGKMSAMLSGRVDGLIGFAHDQGPTIAAKSGREVRYLKYSDAGLNYYSNGLITATDTISGSRELVQSMVDAVRESFSAAIAEPDAAVDSMAGKDPQLPARDVLLAQWRQTVPLLNTPATAGKGPGLNAEEDWKTTLSTLNQAGLLKSANAPDTYWDSSFTPKDK
ncbi:MULTISPECIES: ABC transporter substrate-binding protein [Tsukamurella]|uniref:ABC transporter substrate-binding protein n=1 Tax=Tsukamurella strandjordii TaxID=147577 RepID=A0AA90NA49_9ACTN|nr:MULTISPECIES: ABC transporter substrate-binding protein [Tsukamurella]MDP0397810.1 ABC transporter substrate-binding protein [Tsukamurella strandjordii]GIZ99254.1 sulfonate ABC transporter substrate-binding protein [Tsukamurella sp. TY48]